MASQPEWVPDWLVEKLAAGALSDAEAADVRRRLAAAGQTDRLVQLERSNEEILAAHPPGDVSAEIRRRLAVQVAKAEMARPPARWRLSAAFGGVALSCAAALALVVFVRAPGGSPESSQVVGEQVPGTSAESPETISLKGGRVRPHLAVYRRTPAGPVRLAGAGRVKHGDTLQVAYVAGGRRYGVVASVDAQGTVTLHWPERPGQAARLEGPGETALPNSFELDDSPGFERLVFITADAPFATDSVVTALRTPKQPLPSMFDASEITLRKESP